MDSEVNIIQNKAKIFTKAYKFRWLYKLFQQIKTLAGIALSYLHFINISNDCYRCYYGNSNELEPLPIFFYVSFVLGLNCPGANLQYQNMIS